MRRIITIRDVAKAAGVSIATVSKAMNGRVGMSDATRHKVQAAAKAVGFRRNDLAHALHRGTSRTVGIVSSDNFGRFTMPIAAGLEERLTGEGMSVFLCNATEDEDLERKHISQLLAKRVDGLVFTARRLDKRPAPSVEELRVPVVFAFSQGDASSLSVVPDDAQGARLAVDHLIAAGRMRIAHITGPQHFEAVQQRRNGYEVALRDGRLSYMACHIGRWSEQSGYEMASDLFDGGPEQPDALFCGSDQIARGAMDFMRERGICVPNDVAVIGFDNWDVMAEAARPALSSIDMNLKALGNAAGDMLLKLMNGQKLSGVHRLPCSLVVRHSSFQQ
jgi:LacI family transcriptional regulator